LRIAERSTSLSRIKKEKTIILTGKTIFEENFSLSSTHTRSSSQPLKRPHEAPESD